MYSEIKKPRSVIGAGLFGVASIGYFFVEEQEARDCIQNETGAITDKWDERAEVERAGSDT